MRTRISCVCVLAVAAAAVAAPAPAVKSTGEKLVGKWDLTKSAGAAPSDKHVLEFHKDGSLTMVVGTGDDARSYKGKYTTGKDFIDYELDYGTQKKAEKLTILKFEGDDLKVKDPDDVEEEFKRVKADEKKEEPKKGGKVEK